MEAGFFIPFLCEWRHWQVRARTCGQAIQNGRERIGGKGVCRPCVYVCVCGSVEPCPELLKALKAEGMR